MSTGSTPVPKSFPFPSARPQIHGAIPGTVPGAVPALSAHPRAEEVYGAMAERCWEFFVELMRNVTVPQLCDWKVISR